IFFFSSRRRHTRSKRDWSSDVCSSDLDCLKIAVEVKNIRKEIIALIRLGEALKYNGLHQRAIELFNKALDLCKTHNIDEYEDFVWQHKGKCLMELERLNE